MESRQPPASDEVLEVIDSLPLLPREESPVITQWPWVLKWWAALVTVLTLHIPVFVILVGTGTLELPSSMFITYVSAATGGNTLLAVAGALLLRPFAGIKG